jgi:endogenous inhibitor of DNA gyrase (YacG/DUF329 family)
MAKCAICKKAYDKASEQRPFCSKRCKAVDLGRWFGANYTMPTHEPLDDGQVAQVIDHHEGGGNVH